MCTCKISINLAYLNCGGFHLPNSHLLRNHVLSQTLSFRERERERDREQLKRSFSTDSCFSYLPEAFFFGFSSFSEKWLSILVNCFFLQNLASTAVLYTA